MPRRKTFGVYRHLLGADLRAAATPDVAEAESRTSTFDSPSGSAINTTARAGWRPASFETEAAVISCADSSSVTTIRLSTLERRASVPSSFARSLPARANLPDAHPFRRLGARAPPRSRPPPLPSVPLEKRVGLLWSPGPGG